MSGYNRFSVEERMMNAANIGIKYRQFQAAILAGLAGMAAGTLDGWILAGLKFEKELKSLQVFGYGYIIKGGAFFGVLLAGYLAEQIGRKKTLVLIGAIMLPVWVLFSFPNIWTLGAGTALGGLAVGGASVAVPVYIAEMADDSIRGVLATFFYLQFISGEFVTVLGDSHERFSTTSASAILIAIIFLVTFVWMPESSYYLATNGLQLEAKRSLEFFQGPNEHIEEDITKLQELAANKGSIKDTLKEEKVQKAIMISIVLMILSCFLAIDGFDFHLISVSHLPGTEEYNVKFGLILVIQIIGVCGSGYFIEKIGRRLTLLISTVVMSLTSAVVVFFAFFNYFISERIGIWIIGTYISSFSFGLAPVPWVLAGELLPIQHKVMSYTMLSATFWIMAFFAGLRTKLMIHIFDENIIVLYLVISLFTVAFIWFMIPETKGKDANSIVIDFRRSFFRSRNSEPALV